MGGGLYLNKKVILLKTVFKENQIDPVGQNKAVRIHFPNGMCLESAAELLTGMRAAGEMSHGTGRCALLHENH